MIKLVMHKINDDLNMSSTFIAFDFGMTKMGVAIGQNITNTASPLDPIIMRNGNPDSGHLEQILKEYNPVSYTHLTLPTNREV